MRIALFLSLSPWIPPFRRTAGSGLLCVLRMEYDVLRIATGICSMTYCGRRHARSSDWGWPCPIYLFRNLNDDHIPNSLLDMEYDMLHMEYDVLHMEYPLESLFFIYL